MTATLRVVWMDIARAVRHRLHREPVEVNHERGAAGDFLAARLADVTRTRMTRASVPGAQVAVRRDGDLVWSACAGRHRLGSGRTDPGDEVRPQDRFVAASVTKLVVACTALCLADSGDLPLDEPITRWLPDLPRSDEVTVRMLLRHRSGLREYFEDERIRRKMTDEPAAAWSRDELLGAVAELGSETDPDEQFAYRNSNYIAIGEILARCTGQTVEAVVQERVCRPLGLSTLSFAGHEHGAGRLAAPHKRRLTRAVDLLSGTDNTLPSHTTGDVWTDGGVATSAEDLAALTEAAFAGRLLSPATVDDMTRRSASPGSAVGGVLGVLQTIYSGRARRSYGLGVAVEERRGATTFGHEGMYYGWSAVTSFDPRTKVTISVLTNLAAIPVPAERLGRELREVLAGGFAAT